MLSVALSLVLSVALSFDWLIPATQTPETSTKQSRPTTVIKQRSKKQKPAKDVVQEAEQSEYLEDLLSEKQKRALYRLRNLQSEIREIDNPEVKVKLQAQIADALWGFDKASSRELFITAYEEIENMQVSKNKLGKPETESVSRTENSKGFKSGLRSYVIRLISSHDIELADKLLNTDTKPNKSTNDVYEDNKERSAQRLRLAVNIAPSNPEQALAIIKDETKRDLSENSIGALIVTRRHHSKMSDLAFYDILSWADKSNKHLSYNSLGFLGMYLLGAEREKDNASGIGIRVETIREYLKYAHKIVTYNIQNNLTPQGQEINQAYSVLQNLLPLFEAYLPADASKLRSHLNNLENSISQKVKEQILAEKPSDPSSVDDLLSLAEREANTGRKDSIITRAALLATSQGNVDKALFIADKLSDDSRKKRIISTIHYQFSRKSVSAKEMEQALKYAREIIIPAQRWIIFLDVAEWYTAKKNNDKAIETLTEVESYIRTLSDDDPEKAWGLFTVSRAWGKLDTLRSIDSMRVAIKYLNSADFNKPQLAGRTKITSDNFTESDLWPYLANADLDKAFSLAHLIQDKTISSMAQIQICKTILPSSKEVIK